MQSYNSLVSLVYDKNLIKLYEEIEKHHKKGLLINDISNNELESIHNSYKNNMNRLNFKGHINKASPKNLFAFVAGFCGDYKNCKTWEEVYSPNFVNLIESERRKCICGHHISDVCVVINETTGIILPVGNCCVNKNMLITDEQKEKYKYILKQFKEEQKQIKTHRQCKICNNYNILKDEPEWKNKCKECYIKHKSIYRLCDECRSPNIPLDKPEWFKKCFFCYSQKRNISYNKEKI